MRLLLKGEILEFPSQLLEGKFIKRYKRFFAEIYFEGKVFTAHVPNTGSLKSCSTPGSSCLFSQASDPKRALKFTLEAILADGHWVGVNTSWPNKLVAEVFSQHRLPHWSKYNSYQQEVKINDQSRIDLVLWDSKEDSTTKWKVDDFKILKPVHFVELKNVTLKERTNAQFPDAVTERGQKHIKELCGLIKRGYTAEMLFVVQRMDVEAFEPAAAIDPKYAQLLSDGYNLGLTLTAICFELSNKGISYSRQLPIKLG
jgi:sugar fermentation stimulation protein A